ncbi:WD40 repeat-like protein [Massarina eburnea CBS 473.64]|uniref:WD40 repeat-like protein n=1 Tax=Massarina eburnea CBS 473.64 TaxID=1395130 RepID=A0A6A6S7V5_9PLEO|nr:WD40 repeat-like protein [Massarina eburnea CBS 473.64]
MFPSAADLVAQFLKANDYAETLQAFIREAGLAPGAGGASGSDITIEQILQEKKTFDLSVNFEKLGVEDNDRQWRVPSPSKPLMLESIPTKSNILSVSLVNCKLPYMSETKTYVATTTADRRLHLFDPHAPSLPLAHSYASFLDSPILDLVVLQNRYLFIGSMSGRLLLFDTEADEVLDQRRDHTKYIVKLATWADGPSTILASAGWDSKIFLYRFGLEDENLQLGEPIAAINLSSIPEALLFIKSPDTPRPIMLLTRKDSTVLYYYSVPLPGETQINLLARQNLAPHSNAWISFTPSDIQLSPQDPSLIAVATSSTPHMKLIVARLLIPPPEVVTGVNSSPGSGPVTQAAQSRANLLVEDREEAAITINISTMAPQTTYSTPRLAWRPDGSGIWVNSDDGIVRGFEATTGKQIAALEGHENGLKVRCLWAGQVKRPSADSTHTPNGDEFLVTGGFDQKLLIWNT